MAAPTEKNIKDLNGVWVMNRELSGDTNAILQLQGIGWFIRKAIGMMTVTLITKQYTDEEGKVHIDIRQPGYAGIEGTTELRTLDSEWRDHEDHIFGLVKGTTKWIKIADIKEDDDAESEKHLKEGWAQETLDGEAIDSYVESVKNGWTARQIWGFGEIGGVRRYIRRVVVKKAGKAQRQVLAYDFKEELKEPTKVDAVPSGTAMQQ